jgi:hypothetical protein
VLYARLLDSHLDFVSLSIGIGPEELIGMFVGDGCINPTKYKNFRLFGLDLSHGAAIQTTLFITTVVSPSILLSCDHSTVFEQ